MRTKYRIFNIQDPQYTYGVEEHRIYDGERINAYESEPDVNEYEIVFKSNLLSECNAFIMVREKGLY